MPKWFSGKGLSPRIVRLTLTSLAVLLLAAVGEWAGFQHARSLGELSMLGVVGAALLISVLIGATFKRNRTLWAGLAGFGAGLAVGLLNYSYLYWIRVVVLQEIDAGLFNYFGTVYGAALQVTAILCGAAAAVTAYVRKS